MSTTASKANAFLDLQGLTCPGPLLGAKRMVDLLEPGQVLLLVSDCPGTHDDLLAWTRQTHNQIIETEKRSGGAMGYYIQKGQMVSHTAQVTLDMRGISCPGPIVEAKKLLNGMQGGEVLKLISNCPGVRSDIHNWAASTGMKVLDMVEVAPEEYEFYVQKGA
jgi:TusA-related sulfurtransferase